MINAQEFFKSPLKTAILLLLSTIFFSLVVHIIFEINLRVLLLVFLCLNSFLIGARYAKYLNLEPSKAFRKVMALYYLIFSRVVIIIVSAFIVDMYIHLKFELFTVIGLLIGSLASLVLSYLLIYFLFYLGAISFLKRKNYYDNQTSITAMTIR